MSDDRTALALAACLTMLLPTAAGAADWERFRGPELDGKSAEKGLLSEWPEDGPKTLWKVTIGEGYSGMSVVGGRVYTMYDVGSKETLACHDAADGKLVWTLEIDDKYEDGMGNGPRSTPAVHGDHVYALGARGKLIAAARDSGKLLWRRDLVEDMNARVPRWGVATEPLIHGDHLLINVGGPKGRGNAAFDRKTGEVVWQAGSDGAGYASPLPVKIGGREQVLFFTAAALTSHDLESGAELWSVPWETDWDVNAATPIFLPPDRVFVASGYSTGSAMLRIDTEKDPPAVRQVWRSKKLKNQFSSSVLVDGHLYGFDNRILECVDAETGEVEWKRSGLGHGSLTYADGRLYVLGERGKLVLVEATPEAYRVHGSVQIVTGKCWTVPTLSGGRLYVRNEEQMICLDVSSGVPSQELGVKVGG